MRIETWNLKKGDRIKLYSNIPIIEYDAKIESNIWERNGLLLLWWAGYRINCKIKSSEFFRGMAIYNDEFNRWRSLGAIKAEYFNENRNMEFKR